MSRKPSHPKAKKISPKQTQSKIAETGKYIAEIETLLAQAKKDNEGKKPPKSFLEWRERTRERLQGLKTLRTQLLAELKESKQPRSPQIETKPPEPPTISPPSSPSCELTLALGLLRRTYDYLKDDIDVLNPESTDEDGFDLFEAIEELLGIAI
jgi:hypothetical protein